jgi:acylphosphatase
VSVVVTGRVQGVWFRDSCRREAERLGVTGWVRNRFDGAVEGEFEGTAGAVAQLLSWCRTGPPRAEVAGVEVRELPPAGSTTFVVRP